MRFSVIFLTCFFTLFCHSKAFSTTYKLLYKGEKVGLTDDEGNILIPAIYDGLGWSNEKYEPVNNLIGFKKDNLWGVLNLQNKKVLVNEFSQLYPAENGLLVAAKRGKYSQRDFLGLINSSGKEVLPFKYASVQVVGAYVIVGVKSGRKYRYGLVDQEDKTIIPFQYRSVEALGTDRFAVKNFEDKLSIFSASGSQLVSFEFDKISSFKNEYAVTYVNHLRGLLHKKKGIIQSPRYKDIELSKPIQAIEFPKWEIIENREIKDVWQFDNMEMVGASSYRVSANKKQWIIDSEGNSQTSESYEVVDIDKNGNYIFKDDTGWGVIRPDSAIVLPPKYDSLLFIKGKYFVSKDKGWVMYDAYGVRKTDQPYKAVKKNYRNYISVQKNEKWGVINQSGEEIIHCVYQDIFPMQNGLMVVKFHGQYGVINKLGNWIVVPKKGVVELLTEELYLRKSGEMSTLKNMEGETIYFTTNRIEAKSGYLLEYLRGGGLWKIDFNGRIVNRDLPQQKFQEIRASSEGLFAVKINNRYGFVDNQNRLLVANRYENVGDFHEGMAAVKLLGKWGFIDKKENLVIQPVYSEVSTFVNGVAAVKQGDKMGIINRQGKKVSTFDYDAITPQADGKFLVEKNGKYGLLAKDGSLLILAKYDYIEELSNGYVKARLFGHYGVLTNNGVDIIPLIYDQLIYDDRFDRYLAMKKTGWENLLN